MHNYSEAENQVFCFEGWCGKQVMLGIHTCVIINRDWLVQKETEDYLDCLAVLVFLERWGFLDCQDMDHKE